MTGTRVDVPVLIVGAGPAGRLLAARGEQQLGWLTAFVACAIAGATLAVASAAMVVPASNKVFISDLTQVDAASSASMHEKPRSRRYCRSRFSVAGETSSSDCSAAKLTQPRLFSSSSIL